MILEVISWHPRFVEAFTAASGGETRLADLDMTSAAALTAHALNIGYTPVISPGVPALTRARISHVDQHYLRADSYAAANAPLIEAQVLTDTEDGDDGATLDGDGRRERPTVRTT